MGRKHSLEKIIKSKMTPEKEPADQKDKFILFDLQSRYQRYELMSAIPIGILIRQIKQRFFEPEIKNLIRFYRDKYYYEKISMHARTKKQSNIY